MKRLSLNLAAVASLLLCLATLLYWPISYLPRNLSFDASEGRLFLIFWNRAIPPHGSIYNPLDRDFLGGADLWQTLQRRSGTRIGPRFSFLGFGTIGGYVTVNFLLIAIPFWFIVSLTAIPPLTFLLHRRRQSRRHRLGLCQTCGYDLRASTDNCSECGSPIPQSKIENQKSKTPGPNCGSPSPTTPQPTTGN